jgi:hypothetical protein
MHQMVKKLNSHFLQTIKNNHRHGIYYDSDTFPVKIEGSTKRANMKLCPGAVCTSMYGFAVKSKSYRIFRQR